MTNRWARLVDLSHTYIHHTSYIILMSYSDSDARFARGICLIADSKKGIGHWKVPPEGMAVSLHTITPQTAILSDEQDTTRVKFHNSSCDLLYYKAGYEWVDILRLGSEYLVLTLYHPDDYEDQTNILAYGDGTYTIPSGPKNGLNEHYVLKVQVDLRWGASEFREKGSLPIPYLRLTYHFLRSASTDIRLKDSENELPTADPPGFLLKLYDYQARTLTWMRRIESGDIRIKYLKDYYHPLPDPDSPDGSPFCYVSGRDIAETAKTMALYQCYTEPPSRFREFPIHGGLLADIMGNGKTVTGIAHICSQLARTGRDAFPKLEPGLEEDIYIPSRATLILCPNNIVDQWYSEFEKCLGPGCGELGSGGPSYRIIKIANIRHLKALSHWDLINADVIIASYGLLSNANHIGKGFVQKNGLSRQFTEHRMVKHAIPEMTDSPTTWDASVYQDLASQLPSKYLHLYKWHRIIHDEFHEVIDVKTRANCLLLLIRHALRATYYWGFSGTPILEKETVLENLPHLLQFQDDWGEILPMKCGGNKELFFDKCVIKNTKRNLPPLHYKTVSITGTSQEKQLYETLVAAVPSQDHLIRFACYHNLGATGTGTGTGTGTHSSLLSAEEIMAKEAEMRQSRIVNMSNVINDTEVCLKTHVSVLEAMSSLPKYPFTQTWKEPEDLFFLCDTSDKLHNAKVRVALDNDSGLRRARDILKEYKKEKRALYALETERSSLEAANDLYNKFKKDRTLNCSLCAFEGPCDEFMVLPGCRHSACIDCMELMREGSQRCCPICRKTSFDGTHLAKLADQDTLQNQALSTSGLNISLWGSKICSVVDTLVTLKREDKVLIFAQWPDLLIQLKIALEEVGIESVSVEGTTASRSVAIHRFQQDPECRVILLNSVHGASGINLVEANHVFLIHHFLGSTGKEYEYQAICRAYRTGQKRPVTVTHFIRDDTVERALHDKRNYVDEKANDCSIAQSPTPVLPPIISPVPPAPVPVPTLVPTLVPTPSTQVPVPSPTQVPASTPTLVPTLVPVFPIIEPRPIPVLGSDKSVPQPKHQILVPPPPIRHHLN